MKYEKPYEFCFDWIVNDWAMGYCENIPKVLKEAGVEIVDEDQLAFELNRFFEQMHEQGTIKPKPQKNEDSSSL